MEASEAAVDGFMNSLRSMALPYTLPSAWSEFQDLSILTSDGQDLRTNKLVFAAVSSYGLAIEEESCFVVELCSSQVKLVLDFVHHGNLPVYVDEDDYSAFEALGISLEDKQFFKVENEDIELDSPVVAENVDDRVMKEEGSPSVQDELDFDYLPPTKRTRLQDSPFELIQDDYEEEEMIVVPRRPPKGSNSKTKRASIAERKEKTHCFHCKRGFVDIEAHKEKVHKEEYKCPQCSKVFFNQWQLNRHISVSHDYTCCELCGKRLANRSLLKNHMVLMHGSKEDRKFKCDKCTRSYISRAKLNEHMATHDNLRTCVCEYCGKGFNTPGNLSCHKTRCMSKDIRKSRKGGISQRNINMEELQSLDIQATSTTQTSCLLCNKNFEGTGAIGQAKTHALSVHHKDMCTNVCKVCHKGFANSTKLKAHMLVHDDKKFVCGVCGSKFTNIGTRNAHEKEVHLGIKKGELKGRSRRKSYQINHKSDVPVEEETFEMRKARWLSDVEEARRQQQLSNGTGNETANGIKEPINPVEL